jgi:hypothetical protein
MLSADTQQLSSVLAPLGFKNRRANTLKNLSKIYLEGNWNHAKELPGIGEYGSAAWEIFCAGNIPTSPPKDHALLWYFNWRIKNVTK